jgi:hypothetical protein
LPRSRSTSRVTIVGAAKNFTRAVCDRISSISATSKPRDAGTSCVAPAATFGTMYRPEPCDIGAACSS